ncbi:MAG TPA: GGDEF domain-containing protein [Candidatus Dormibacteraeota bacterium]|nr:GGDEF domain-containing protein [Candidatus Dormibacteraeota bacterium]
MALLGSQGSSVAQASRLPNGMSHRRVLSMDRRKRLSEKDLEEMLPSALLAADEKELRYLALTDDLTCLYNRRGFFAAATQQLKLARRNAQGLLLFFCDVDNLKKINDSYGHHDGDLAIVRATDALEQTFRRSDILARLGGDEFAVLALEASTQSQGVILRRLAKSLKKSNANESRYEMSLSVGLARFDPKHPVSLGELIAQADQAMYEQKRSRPGACLSKP